MLPNTGQCLSISPLLLLALPQSLNLFSFLCLAKHLNIFVANCQPLLRLVTSVHSSSQCRQLQLHIYPHLLLSLCLSLALSCCLFPGCKSVICMRRIFVVTTGNCLLCNCSRRVESLVSCLGMCHVCIPLSLLSLSFSISLSLCCVCLLLPGTVCFCFLHVCSGSLFILHKLTAPASCVTNRNCNQPEGEVGEEQREGRGKPAWQCGKSVKTLVALMCSAAALTFLIKFGPSCKCGDDKQRKTR